MAWALLLSTLLHAWLMQGSQHFLRTPRVVGEGTAPLTAVLQALHRETPPATTVPRREEAPPPVASLPDSAHNSVTTMATMRPDPALPDQARVKTLSTLSTLPHAEPSHAPLPQANDPTYYGALSLDVYPRAVTPLELGERVASAAAGQVRATVWIDESGIVNEVRAIQAVAPEVENAARALLWQTRFTPARKEGRVVKAQLRVSLDYGARP